MRRSTVRLLSLALFTVLGCSDHNSTAPPAGRPSFAAGGQGNGNGKTSLDLIEDDYTNGLLDKNNVNRYREYAVDATDLLPAKYKSTVRMRPIR